MAVSSPMKFMLSFSSDDSGSGSLKVEVPDFFGLRDCL